MIGIYKITSPTKKIYIGQSVDIERRFSEYKRYHCKDQQVLYRSLKKYGYNKHKFEILEQCEVNDLNLKERYYQELFEVIGNNGMNLNIVSIGERSGYVSQETKTKISNTKIGKKRGKFSQSWIDNMSKSRKGRKMPPRSKEWKLKQSIAQSNKTKSKETLEKLYKIGRKKVYKFDLKGRFIDEYESLKEAAKSANIAACVLSSNISGKNKTAGGYLWSFTKNIEVPSLTNSAGYYFCRLY